MITSMLNIPHLSQQHPGYRCEITLGQRRDKENKEEQTQKKGKEESQKERRQGTTQAKLRKHRQQEPLKPLKERRERESDRERERERASPDREPERASRSRARQRKKDAVSCWDNDTSRHRSKRKPSAAFRRLDRPSTSYKECKICRKGYSAKVPSACKSTVVRVSCKLSLYDL